MLLSNKKHTFSKNLLNFQLMIKMMLLKTSQNHKSYRNFEPKNKTYTCNIDDTFIELEHTLNREIIFTRAVQSAPNISLK